MKIEIRWKQRFVNYEKAFKQLSVAVEKYSNNPPDIIKEGIIQRFEFTHELAWKVLKDYLEYEGHLNIAGSRTATREAFNIGIIKEGKIWMNMIESRNITVHAYDEKILKVEFEKIINEYYFQLKEFHKTMKDRL